MLCAHGREGQTQLHIFLAAHFAKRNTKFGGGGTPVVERFAFTTGQAPVVEISFHYGVKILFRADSVYKKPVLSGFLIWPSKLILEFFKI